MPKHNGRVTSHRFDPKARTCWNCGRCKRKQLFCKLTIRQIAHPAQLPVECKWWTERDPSYIEEDMGHPEKNPQWDEDEKEG